jgi:NAD(P)-dependent dehydrogenase (short-subunit alcohol dehydrogenase family)
MNLPDNVAVPDFPGLLRLDGHGFVVLGAGQGIGRQTSHALAQAGARVVAVDREADLAAQVAGELGDSGVPCVGDITKRGDVERLVAEARDALGGRIHGAVDIVGMAQYASLLDTTDELWEWEHDIVLRHAWLTMQCFGRAMKADGGGSLAFVASVSGVAGAPMHSSYGAFKAALMALVRSAAVELGPAGVRVNAVAPGVVWTPRVSAYLGEKGHASNAENAPLRRVALPADIAAALLFLSSDLAGYVSGQTLVVDGGVSAKFGYPMPEVASG